MGPSRRRQRGSPGGDWNSSSEYKRSSQPKASLALSHGFASSSTRDDMHRPCRGRPGRRRLTRHKRLLAPFPGLATSLRNYAEASDGASMGNSPFTRRVCPSRGAPEAACVREAAQCQLERSLHRDKSSPRARFSRRARARVPAGGCTRRPMPHLGICGKEGRARNRSGMVRICSATRSDSRHKRVADGCLRDERRPRCLAGCCACTRNESSGASGCMVERMRSGAKYHGRQPLSSPGAQSI